MVSSAQPVRRGYLPDHLASQAARSALASARSRRSPGSGFAGPRTGSEPLEFLRAVVGVLARQVVERTPEEVDVTALPCGFRDHLADRRDEPGVIVGDDQYDALETARLQADEKFPPGRSALAIGHLDRQDLAPPVPVDVDRGDAGDLGDFAAGLEGTDAIAVYARAGGAAELFLDGLLVVCGARPYGGELSGTQ